MLLPAKATAAEDEDAAIVAVAAAAVMGGETQVSSVSSLPGV